MTGIDRRGALGLMALAASGLAACDRDRDVPRRRTPPAPASLPALPEPPAGSVFPLRIEPGRPYLLDASGRPFLIVGESAWSLLAQLPRPDIDAFLEDRRRRGYNAVMLSVLESHFSARPPYNSEGQVPFAVPRRFDDVAEYLRKLDFDTPVDAYFDLFEHVVARAAALGMLVLAVPCYAGYGGGEQGWWAAMKRSDPDALRQFGRYLGKRFRGHRNLLWVQGGDFNVPDRRPVDALAQGILEYDRTSLHTYHGSRGTGAHDWMPEAPWMTLGNIYTKEVSYEAALRYRAARPTQPFFLIEAYYENYADARPDRRLTRLSAYQALLSGACGQLSGHDDIWQFRPSWRQALDSVTARSMSVLAAVYGGLAWWTLVPDTGGRFLRSEPGAGFERVTAAVAGDGRFALAYVPAQRETSVATEVLAGPRVRLQWIDPVDGRRVPAEGAAASALLPPGPNAAGDPDWLLLAESVN